MSTVEAQPQIAAALDAPERAASQIVTQSPRRRVPRRLAADLVGVADIAAVLAAFLLPAVIYSKAGGIVADWPLLVQSGFAAAIIVHMMLRLSGMYARREAA